MIQQGDEGDYFYIVKKGDFDIFVKKGDDPPKRLSSEIVWMPKNPPTMQPQKPDFVVYSGQIPSCFPPSSPHLTLHHPFTISSLHRKNQHFLSNHNYQLLLIILDYSYSLLANIFP